MFSETALNSYKDPNRRAIIENVYIAKITKTYGDEDTAYMAIRTEEFQLFTDLLKKRAPHIKISMGTYDRYASLR